MEFEAFPKIPRLRITDSGMSVECLQCDAAVGILSGRLGITKFCSKRCRETHWVSNNRSRLNAATRACRRRRYIAEGSWRESGQKAKALKSWMVGIKSKPCADCGGTFATCCMDFDHREGHDKKYNVGSMFAHHYSRELIEAEISKCDLVCANCHRVRTRDRRTGSGSRNTPRRLGVA